MSFPKSGIVGLLAAFEFTGEFQMYSSVSYNYRAGDLTRLFSALVTGSSMVMSLVLPSTQMLGTTSTSGIFISRHHHYQCFYDSHALIIQTKDKPQRYFYKLIRLMSLLSRHIYNISPKVVSCCNLWEEKT